MKIFIFLFILGLCSGQEFLISCNATVSPLKEPHCGMLPECYLNATNANELETYECRRWERGLSDFAIKRPGVCPYDKPQCPRLCKGTASGCFCDREVILTYDPYCGITPKCYQSAPNFNILDIYSCMRIEKGLPDFTYKKRGECPAGRRPCPEEY